MTLRRTIRKTFDEWRKPGNQTVELSITLAAAIPQAVAAGELSPAELGMEQVEDGLWRIA